MVTKWLKSRDRKKSATFKREHPPIQVTPNAIGIIPPNIFASISLFQNERHHSLCINHFGSSQNGETIHIAILAPSLSFKAASACRQITQDCWHQQLHSSPGWINSIHALEDWIQSVQKSLIDFGGGSLATGLQGLTLDHGSKKALFFLSGLAGAILISKDGDIEHLAAAAETGLMGNHDTKVPKAQVVSTKSLAAIVLASDDFHVQALEKAIKKIRTLPYPKSGAAELLFFELQKTGSGSSVLWIDF